MDEQNLHLESTMKTINIRSESAFHLKSHASHIRFESLKGTKILAKEGKVYNLFNYMPFNPLQNLKKSRSKKKSV